MSPAAQIVSRCLFILNGKDQRKLGNVGKYSAAGTDISFDVDG
jgi:hypothetical protein